MKRERLPKHAWPCAVCESEHIRAPWPLLQWYSGPGRLGACGTMHMMLAQAHQSFQGHISSIDVAAAAQADRKPAWPPAVLSDQLVAPRV